MKREGEASTDIGRIILGGRVAYHRDGYLYCPGQGIFEFSVRRRPDEDGNLRWIFDCGRSADDAVLPRKGWVTLPTWLEAMRQPET
jgi:hypothetical protein